MRKIPILSRLLSRFQSIRTQLFFTYSVLIGIMILCISVALGFLSQFFFRQNMEITGNTLEIIGESIEGSIDTLRRLVPLVRDDKPLQRAMEESGDSDIAIRRMSALYAYGLQHRYVITLDGRIVDPLYDSNANYTETNLQLAGFYEFLKSGKEEAFSAPHQFPFPGQMGERISFFHTLRDFSEQYRVYGYVMFIVSIHSLFEERVELLQSQFDDFYIIDGNGRLIFSASGDSANPQTLAYAMDHIPALATQMGHQNDGHLYFSAPVNSYLNWRMVGVVAQSAFYRSMYITFLVVGLFGLLGAILVFGLSTAIIKGVSRPVSALRTSMKAFESGQIPQKIPPHPMSEEMHTLVGGFNHMLDNIHAHLDTIVREQNEKKTAEVAALEYQLQSLQHQINPHFLYNTLNIISFLALDGKSAEIRSFNQSLIALLRATLSNTQDTVTVQREIAFLEAYVDIMAYRYPSLFTVNIRVDDDLWDCQIPKLILQPLVENAMLHGIVLTGKKGLIEVLIESRGEWMHVTVGDDGVGMNQEKIKMLLEPRKRFTGIGLSNINDRLKLCYGNDSSLVISSEQNMGTVVMFKIPKNFEA